MELRSSRTIILNHGSPDAKRAEIREYFHKSYTLDEQLYASLAGDAAFFLRAEPLRHPLIFYLGHTAAFYINKLMVAGIIEERVNPHFESMFAIGVDEPQIMERVVRMMKTGDFNPHFFDYPSLYIYVQLVVAVLRYLLDDAGASVLVFHARFARNVSNIQVTL